MPHLFNYIPLFPRSKFVLNFRDVNRLKNIVEKNFNNNNLNFSDNKDQIIYEKIKPSHLDSIDNKTLVNPYIFNIIIYNDELQKIRTMYCDIGKSPFYMLLYKEILARASFPSFYQHY